MPYGFLRLSSASYHVPNCILVFFVNNFVGQGDSKSCCFLQKNETYTYL